MSIHAAQASPSLVTAIGSALDPLSLKGLEECRASLERNFLWCKISIWAISNAMDHVNGNKKTSECIREVRLALLKRIIGAYSPEAECLLAFFFRRDQCYRGQGTNFNLVNISSYTDDRIKRVFPSLLLERGSLSCLMNTVRLHSTLAKEREAATIQDKKGKY